jgi:hypothetical protein
MFNKKYCALFIVTDCRWHIQESNELSLNELAPLQAAGQPQKLYY